jgi:hypothetical protein
MAARHSTYKKWLRSLRKSQRLKKALEAVQLREEIELYESPEFNLNSDWLPQVSLKVIDVDLIRACQPVFDKILKKTLHKSYKGITDEQKKRLKEILMEKRSGKKRPRSKDQKGSGDIWYRVRV